MTAAATSLRLKDQPKDPSNEIVSMPRSATAIISSPSLFHDATPSDPEKRTEFDDEDHARGILIRKVVTLTVQAAVLGVGKLASETYQKMLLEKKPVNGRNSIYGLWLRVYVPALERKTIDRLRRVFELFHPLLQETETPCLDCLERFDLTALYLLVESRVTDDDRRDALKMAMRGKRIDAKLARSIAGESVMKDDDGRKADRHKKTIKLPAGNVTLTINHSDFRQALKEALTLV